MVVFLSGCVTTNEYLKEADIMIESFNEQSNRIAVFEDDGNTAYLYLLSEGGIDIEKMAIVYSRIEPVLTVDKERMNAGLPPKISKRYASDEAFIALPEEEKIEFKWSADGHSVAILYDGKERCFVSKNSELFGYSKAVKKDGPYGKPWNPFTVIP
jgi:hypothetical protein